MSTQIGTLTLNTTLADITVPVFNLVPSGGAPAQFGFSILSPVVMDVSLRSGRDYGISVTFRNISQLLPTLGASLTLWGVPADPVHDPFRGKCLGFEGDSLGICPTNAVPKPLLTLPTSCSGPLKIAASVDSWENPGVFVKKEVEGEAGEATQIGLQGCGRLGFQPSIAVHPEATAADSPTGALIEVSIPQNSSPTGLAEANLKNAVIVLPTGLSINPSAADGLVGCTPAQIGLDSAAPPNCPDASKIGALEIDTPLLAHPLLGSVYLAKPENEPFDGHLSLYVAAEEEGIVAKLSARLVADQSTGQITMNLDIPELPFAEVKLQLSGGPRAVLANASRCGTFTTTSQMTPYSAPGSGAPATPSSKFTIDENCSGGFSPALVAGSASAAAGQSATFALQLSRSDGERYIQGLSTTLPSGLAANLSVIPICGDAAANAGACGASSRIGSAIIAAGSGSHPYQLSGQVFLTGPYEGAPFGMSIVTPGVAGPFNLGTVVTRASISMDPNDARLTIRAKSLPTILGGVPLRTKAIYLTIDRTGFMLNPTNCTPQEITSLVTPTEGPDVTVSTPFKVSGCARLPLAPILTASTEGRTSKSTGASLRIKLSRPAGNVNMRSAKIELPKRLPIELTTLQKACPDEVFAVNPTSCPKESQVGVGIARTPLFANPLTGTTYLVSHGDREFPSLVVVLQGEGVTFYVHGNTSVHRGKMRTTFAIPDLPISSFQLDFPRRSFPLFGSNLPAKAKGSFCSSRLLLPATILGQNGAKFTQRTKIHVAGCSQAKK